MKQGLEQARSYGYAPGFYQSGKANLGVFKGYFPHHRFILQNPDGDGLAFALPANLGHSQEKSWPGGAVEKSPKKSCLATGADFGIVTVGGYWGLQSSRMPWSADRGQRPQYQQKAEGYPDEFP